MRSLIVLAIFCTVLAGCYPVTSRSDVIGVYTLKAGKNSIDLELSSDQNFKETIKWASGKVEARTGEWYWRPGWVSFDRLWIPEAFAPNYIKETDANSSSKGPKYTEPGYWSVSVERDWGTVTLSVFDDVGFKMVAPSTSASRH